VAINVLVVDDSAVVRQMLTEILNNTDDIRVYDVAPDPIFAESKMAKQWPDVIILDIEMPRMDGITFLKKIMESRPTPVIICSSLTGKGTEASVKALALGAVDILTKPSLGIKGFLFDKKSDILGLVRSAAASNIKCSVSKKLKEFNLEESQPALISKTTDKIVAIGTSTGGTQALERILTMLPKSTPGIVVVQHMPEKFTRAFAERLNGLCKVEVLEAENGSRICAGRVLIAPGGKHLEVQKSGAQYVTKVFSGPAVKRHCPSIDVLFRSVAKNVRSNAMGVIMTGMGDDGAQGLLEMKKSGSKTIAQNEASCVVYGMPKEAVKLGAANHVVDLDGITNLIVGNNG